MSRNSLLEEFSVSVSISDWAGLISLKSSRSALVSAAIDEVAHCPWFIRAKFGTVGVHARPGTNFSGEQRMIISFHRSDVSIEAESETRSR